MSAIITPNILLLGREVLWGIFPRRASRELRNNALYSFCTTHNNRRQSLQTLVPRLYLEVQEFLVLVEIGAG